MAELFVSSLLSPLIENLAPVALSFIPSGGIDQKLKEWTSMLLTIETVLEDAEARQIVEKPIQLWLHDVKKLAFEIEDLVDDLASESQRREMIATPESSRPSKIRKLTYRFSPTAIRFNYAVDHKIDQISKSLQDLEKRKNILKLQDDRTGDFRLPLTSSLVDSRICGREEDSAAILTWLLEDRASNHDGPLRVISIFGMGGIGKTTLAQSLYNNEGVKESFSDRAWVCVTQDFDVFKISKKIYEEVYEHSCEFNELNKVQEKLREKFSKTKFLLVLDDVWNDDEYAKWDLLSAPLRVGAPGSTIIVTTRSQDVANTMGSKEVYHLKELSDGDCLSLLAQHAFERPNFDGHPEFKEAGEVIAKRCKGLALAAKSLGGILRTKRNRKQWEEVSTSKIWELRSNDIIPALRLSYHHLPPYLKPLFVYCSLFPKGYEFDKQELIMLWMAQGFLRQSGEQKQMEELGCEYFGELLSRSFFQPSTSNKSRYLMHDLNNDLAQFIAGRTHFRLDDKMISDKQDKVSEARHLSFISDQYDDFRQFKASNVARCLRTLLPIRGKFYGDSYLSSLILTDLPTLPCLRALSFGGYTISEIPESIGNLNHLRYLDVSRTNIKELPKSVCALSNLQTLLLHGCYKLVRLPTSIQKLINLRHLDIADTPSLEEMPLGIGLLTHLHTLSKFIVDESDERKITELKGLHHLQGTLSIVGIENVMDVHDAMEANLLHKEGLHGLEMKWSSIFDGTRDEGLEFEVLDRLRPQTKLASLEIEFYGGQKFPGWVGDHSFCDMVKLRLIGCRNCTYLPPLGQLTSLKELYIKGMDGVKAVGQEFLGTDTPHVVAFQSLIKLTFGEMKGWEEWCIDENLKAAFPRLQELEMSKCMKLKKVSLPKIPSLGQLWIHDCSETVLRIMVGLGSVKELEISGISGLSKLDEGIIWCLREVEDLIVIRCEQLGCLWEEKVACQVLKKMKRLSVIECEQLESLGDEEQLLPHNLVSLELRSCDKLEKIPNWQNNLTSLRRLDIDDCKKLQDNLASTSEHKEYEFPSLESVFISDCPSLKWFPTGKKLPTTLRDLTVWNCENMEEVENGMSLSLLESVRFWSWSKLKSLPQGLVHLTLLDIYDCSGIESIPERSLPPTLITLEIFRCSNLKYMLCANEMQSLTSLRRLKITACINLEGYPSEGRWPPNLESLVMGDVKKPITEWGLVTLPTSLLDLTLIGEFPQLVSFSEVGTQLPSSLTSSLHTLTLIGEFPQVVSFSDVGTQLPTSLTGLGIWYLKNLESLGEGLQNLSSLQRLIVWGCPKLRKLPETLLSRLSSLEICECRKLSERCKKEKRDYWPKISHIPCLKINGELMWGL